MNFNVLNKISEVLKEDANNPIIVNIFENVSTKYDYTNNEYELLQNLKDNFYNIQDQVKLKNINEAINTINDMIGKLEDQYIDIPFNNKVNRFNLKKKVIALKESKAFEHPVVVELVNLFENTNVGNKHDYDNFGFTINYLNSVKEFTEIDYLLKDIKNHINENKKEILLYETVSFLKEVPEMYDDDIYKMKKMVINESISSSRIETSLDKVTLNNSYVNEMIEQMKTLEGISENFNLGGGNLNVIVENYIGPANIANKEMVLPIGNSFYAITDQVVNESEYVLGKSGKYTIYEKNINDVFEKENDFYRVSESFSNLGFVHGNKKLYAKLRELPISFKINENNNVDLYIDNKLVENVNDVSYQEIFVMENSNKKNDAINLIKNVDKIYNVEFVKTVINENRKDYIISLDKDYYVFDYNVNENKTNIFKMNSVQLYKHIRDTFNYDIRGNFNLDINENENTILRLKNERQTIKEYISELEKLHETFNVEDDEVKDDALLNDINNLNSQIQQTINYLKDEYIKTGDEIEQTSQEPEMLNKYFGHGDVVNVQPDNVQGKVVASNPDDNIYSVACDNGEMVTVPGDKLILVKVQLINDDEGVENTEGVENAENAANLVSTNQGNVVKLNDDDNINESDEPDVSQDAQMPDNSQEVQSPDDSQDDTYHIYSFKFNDGNLTIEDANDETKSFIVDGMIDETVGTFEGEVSAKNEEDAKYVATAYILGKIVVDETIIQNSYDEVIEIGQNGEAELSRLNFAVSDNESGVDSQEQNEDESDNEIENTEEKSNELANEEMEENETEVQSDEIPDNEENVETETETETDEDKSDENKNDVIQESLGYDPSIYM